MRERRLWPTVITLLAVSGTVQGQSTTWHDDSFTDSTGRTLLYRYWVRNDWDLTTPRGAAIYFHGNNIGTAEELREVRWTIIDPALELDLAFISLASPSSNPEERYGGLYGGGFHARCGCFWLDFDGDDSHDTYAIAPPFHKASWKPSFQWTRSAASAVGDRFRVYVEATTEDFLHPAAVSMSRYYSDWLGLETRSDLESPGGHCRHSDTPRREIYDWLSSGSVSPHSGSGNDTDGDGTPNQSDLDDDGDGAPDFIDDLPQDRRDWRDTDGDGIADARDSDADGDGVGNAVDAFPMDSRERRDTDGDGIGDRLDDDDDNDGLPDSRDPQPTIGTDNGRSLSFVSRNDPISGYLGTHVATQARVHAGRPSGVVYPAARGDAQFYQFLELGDRGGRFEIMVDSFTRPESCRSVLLPQLCNVEDVAASGYYSSYFQDQFVRIWIDRNRNQNLTDDGPPLLTAWNTERPWPVTTNEAVLEVPYASGRVLPYAITMSARRGDLAEGLFYGWSSVWTGEVGMPSGRRVLALTVDGNGDGLFNSRRSELPTAQDWDFVCLDLDQDGWLNECDFAEDAAGNRTRPGAVFPSEPFDWNGSRYTLSVAPSGREISIVEEDGVPPEPPPDPPTSGCTPTTTALRFDGGYEVSMCYRTPEGNEGQAKSGIWASSQSGLLWFFNRENAEVLVKVLDGCAHNGHRWVFVAPVTTLEFNLLVTGPNGHRWTHSNQQNVTAAAKSDTSAFRCADEN